MKTIILYHASCADGFGAAFASWLKYKDQATYIPVSHGKEPPAIEPCDQLYILDFSYPRETLEKLQEKARRIVILDHHRTAETDLKDLPDPIQNGPGIFARFDMNESGATLAWEHFHPETDTPEFFLYLRSRDLWLWDMEDSREFSAGLASYPFDFELWGNFYAHDLDEIDRLISDGSAILRAQEQRVKNLCRHPKFILLGGHHVPCVNATSDFSEVGEYLCEQYPDAPFSASFSIRDDDKVQFSLRSRNGFDVSEIAKKFNGGGHSAAAGFVIPLRDFPTTFNDVPF